jgi:hypothetical protein
LLHDDRWRRVLTGACHASLLSRHHVEVAIRVDLALSAVVAEVRDPPCSLELDPHRVRVMVVPGLEGCDELCQEAPYDGCVFLNWFPLVPIAT